MININYNNFAFIFIGFTAYFVLSYFDKIPSYDFFNRASTMQPLMAVSGVYLIFFFLGIIKKHIKSIIHICQNYHFFYIVALTCIILISFYYISRIIARIIARIIRRVKHKDKNKEKNKSLSIISSKTTYHYFIDNMIKNTSKYYPEMFANSLLFIFKDNELVSFGFYEYADFKKEVKFQTIILTFGSQIKFEYYKRISEDIKTKSDLKIFIADAYTEDYQTKQIAPLAKIRSSEYFDTSGYSIVSVDPDLFEMHYKTIIKNEINEKQKTLLK